MVKRAVLTTGLATLVSGQSPTSISGSVATSVQAVVSPSATQPCAAVSSLQAAAAASGSSRSLRIPASLGHQCLLSVPVDKNGDVQLIDELKLYLQWNTDTAYLSNLPDWYANPPMDLFGEMDKIKAAIMSDKYQSEWEVQSAITALLTRTGDNHIAWVADINTVIGFPRGRTLVSVSLDGTKTPSVYDYGDLFALYNGANFTASPVTEINGEAVTTYLNNVSQQLTYHDIHAKYNGLFPNQAASSLGNLNLGAFQFGIYDGPNTTYTYENGSSAVFPNFATIGKNFTGVDSGAAFFSKFCTGPTSTSTAALTTNPVPTSTPLTPVIPTSTEASSAQPTQTTAIDYPPAVFLHPGFAIGGYYVNGSDNLAVLSIPTFEPTLGSGVVPEYELQPSDLFQAVARDFIRKAAADGKSQLIIDLRANGGGNVVLGFDLFKLLFPNLEPYQATRRRAHQAYKQLVDVTDSQIDVLQYTLNQPQDQLEESQVLSEFSYRISITPSGTDFASSEEFYGPRTFNGDNFTSLRALNLSNTFAFAPNFTVSGYGSELATNQPAFNASNIVLLQDGGCSSTCAIFSELMRTLAGVETLAIGGLPDNTVPMQKVGGTKGWQTWVLANLNLFARAFFTFANQTTLDAAVGSEIEALNNTEIVNLRAAGFQVNAADGIRLGDEVDQTPLQFVFEAAECRIYYTPPMIFDVTETWKAVADTKWGSRKCNAGKGFGTLATQGDGLNSTQPQPYPGPSSNSAAGLSLPSLAMLAVVFMISAAM